MRISPIIFWILLCISCSTSDEEMTPVMMMPDEEMEIDEPVLAPAELIIDTTDLAHLPRDIGGSHVAYPLRTTEAVYGHYAYTPSGYEDHQEDYPLILFLHGWGERGNSGTEPEVLDRVLLHGPPKLIKERQWKPTYPYVVISPQLIGEYWDARKVHEFLDFVIANYRINTKRIYLTGLSLGGGGCWYYVGELGEEHYAAAILPISARGEERIIDNLTQVPIWAFHGESDELVPYRDNYGSATLVEAINARNPKVRAKLCVFPGAAHDAWTRTYSNNFYNSFSLYDPFDTNIYDWMLQYKKE